MSVSTGLSQSSMPLRITFNLVILTRNEVIHGSTDNEITIVIVLDCLADSSTVADSQTQPAIEHVHTSTVEVTILNEELD